MVMWAFQQVDPFYGMIALEWSRFRQVQISNFSLAFLSRSGAAGNKCFAHFIHVGPGFLSWIAALSKTMVADLISNEVDSMELRPAIFRED